MEFMTSEIMRQKAKGDHWGDQWCLNAAEEIEQLTKELKQRNSNDSSLSMCFTCKKVIGYMEPMHLFWNDSRNQLERYCDDCFQGLQCSNITPSPKVKPDGLNMLLVEEVSDLKAQRRVLNAMIADLNDENRRLENELESAIGI